MGRKELKKSKDVVLKFGYTDPEVDYDKKTGKKGYRISYYYWYENGKRRRNNGTWHATKEECIKEAEARIKGNADIVYIQSRMTVRGLIKQYMDYISTADIDEVAPSTKINRYNNCVSLLNYTPEEKVLDVLIKKLDVDTMKYWLNSLKTVKSKHTGKTFGRDYYDDLKNTIRLIIRYADTNNYFDNSLDRYTALEHFILTDVGKARPKRNEKEFRYMTFDEFKRFATCILYDYDVEYDELDTIDFQSIFLFNINSIKLDYEKIKYKNLVYFMFVCCMFFLGTRTEECRILSFDGDIDFEAGEHEGRVSISKAFTSYYFKSDTEAYLHKLRTKNAGSVRKIPIHPYLKNLLVEYKKYIDENHLKPILFPGDDNGYLSYSQINHKIERTLIKAGMKDKKFSKHDFRRSAAMFLCYDMKLPKDQAIAFFGWTSTDMLDDVYAKYNELQRAEMLEKNLDEVGFFKERPNVFYYENGKVYFGKEAELRIKKEKPDDYDKHYRQNDNNKEGHTVKK